MALETYHAKRDFRRTPEPRGTTPPAPSTGNSFVVQKHAASRLHYDFRLELNGVLLSWAVPKGPSLDPADKRLAMHVEDHPLEYGGFEGIIPAGEYGGGTVMLWDRGTWAPAGDPAAGYEKGELKFTLQGEKLKGRWVLVRTRGSKYGGKSGDKAWLLIKEKDEYARPGDGLIVETAPDSVASGRSLEQIAHAQAHVWRSQLSVEDNLRAGAIEPTPAAPWPRRTAAAAPEPRAGEKAAMPTGRKAAMPALLEPVLATLVADPPAGGDWISEIKYDGYRMLCRIEGGRAHLFSRNGKDWTASFPTLARDLASLPVTKAWLDGEVVVVDAGGRSNFQALQNALSAPGAEGLALFVFDMLYRDGFDLRDLPLTGRKQSLREVVGDGIGAIRQGPEMRGSAREFFEQACKLRLEGIVCKKADSTYASGTRSRQWLKVKCLQRQEMVIGGYTDPHGSRKGVGALLLGYYEGNQLRYAGKVGTGFDDKTLGEVTQLVKDRVQDASPFVDPPRGYAAKGAHWIRPELVAEVAFTEWSGDGALRHPSFQGMRLDKKASEVVRESPVAATADAPLSAQRATVGARKDRAGSGHDDAVKGARRGSGVGTRPAAGARRNSKDKTAPVEVEGIPVSSPDKPYFPEAQLTKLDLAQYYADVAARLVPHVKGRPLSLVRCPDGWSGQCFYQKHADPAVHKSVARIEAPERNGTATYLGASSAAALVGLLQWGVIELHPWGSRTPRLDRPDRLIFDFDPDDDLPWKELVTAVGLMRSLLGEMKLTGFLKTTGGKGLHIVLPIRSTLDWDEAKSFTRAVAEFLVRTFPERFTAVMAKERRKGKIFIDYLRNAEGATAIAPYAVRARANAPVATPIDWGELDRDVRFHFFNVRNVPERLERMREDPWAGFFTTRQSITAAMRKRLA